jgi:hypothetical protein
MRLRVSRTYAKAPSNAKAKAKAAPVIDVQF